MRRGEPSAHPRLLEFVQSRLPRSIQFVQHTDEAGWRYVWPVSYRVRISDAAGDVLRGVAFGYPLCCALRFAAETVVGHRTRSRGVKFCSHRDGLYVPCGVLHRAERSGWEHFLKEVKPR